MACCQAIFFAQGFATLASVCFSYSHHGVRKLYSLVHQESVECTDGSLHVFWCIFLEKLPREPASPPDPIANFSYILQVYPSSAYIFGIDCAPMAVFYAFYFAGIILFFGPATY
jgi:hypothetical protein